MAVANNWIVLIWNINLSIWELSLRRVVVVFTFYSRVKTIIFIMEDSICWVSWWMGYFWSLLLLIWYLAGRRYLVELLVLVLIIGVIIIIAWRKCPFVIWIRFICWENPSVRSCSLWRIIRFPRFDVLWFFWFFFLFFFSYPSSVGWSILNLMLLLGILRLSRLFFLSYQSSELVA